MGILYETAVLLIACQLIPLLLGPIVVKLFHSSSARPGVFVIEERELPPPTALYFSSLGPAFESLGFKLLAYLRIEGVANNIVSYMVYLCNRNTMDVASAVTLFRLRSEFPTVRYFEFCRKFTDGSEIDTNNTRQPGVFGKDPEKLVFRFPHAGSPESLWDLHQRLIRREQKRSLPFLPPEGTEVEAFRAHFARVYEKQSEIGYFRADESGYIYRPTWKGACLMTWRLCWPIKIVLAAIGRVKTKKMLRELYQS